MNTAAINWNIAEHGTDAASFTPCLLSLEEQIEDAYASLDAAYDALSEGWGSKEAVKRQLANVRRLLKIQAQPLRCKVAA